MTHYTSIFISDIHLGARGCQADAVCSFLKLNTCDNLFLVGDIVDGWQLSRRWWFPQSHANVIRRILTAAKRGTAVHYILGNHDEALRRFLQFDISVGNISISDHIAYTSVSGDRLLVVHGDCFDVLMHDKRWLMHAGDVAYNAAIWANIHFNTVRRWFNLEYWSLSNWLKQSTKQAIAFITRFEQQLADHCKSEGYDGIICGHIHVAAIKQIDGIDYMNCGDWVESCTALVEHTDGQFQIVEWSNHVKDTSDH
jgi:UDP-2,3-diacylglucosamine pyrophosphatase LpxH